MVYTIEGIQKAVWLQPWAYENVSFLSKDFLIASSNAHTFPFVEISSDKKTIFIPAGEWTINRHLKIPAGYQVIVAPGTTLNLENNAIILSYSPWQSIGTSQNPITIQSSNGAGQGLTILNAEKTSVFEHVLFTGLSRPKTYNWELTGAVTFYESEVSLSHCTFKNNLKGDDVLHIFRSTFEIDNCLFEDIKSDAFDGDFVTGSVTNTRFSNIGNDAIDISGSSINVDTVSMKNIGDKALSVGEKSVMILRNIDIAHSEIGITAKDLSRVSGSLISMSYTRLGFAVFQKKPEFGPGKIVVDRVTMKDIDTLYVLEKRSSLVLNGKTQVKTDKNLKDLLYGNEFGKSSK